jgi:hypothetical protein
MVSARSFGVGFAVLVAGLWLAGCPGKSDENSDAGTDAGEVDSGTNQTTDGGICSPLVSGSCAAPASKCGLVGNKYGCQVPGSKDAGEACTSGTSGDDCADGLFCNSQVCSRICNPAGGAPGCPGGESCALRVLWNGGPSQGGEEVYTCITNSSDCDVLAQDCVQQGTACYLTSSGNKCLSVGSTADQATCVFANDCLKGSTCVDVGQGQKCFPMCSAPQSSSDGGTDGGSDAGDTDAGADGGVGCAVGACHAVNSLPVGLCY